MLDRSNALLAMVGAGVDPAWPMLVVVVVAALGVMGGALAFAVGRGYVAGGFGRSGRRAPSSSGRRSPRRATFWSANW